jgi:RNA polymerase sigma factor (sigma-70 family)
MGHHPENPVQPSKGAVPDAPEGESLAAPSTSHPLTAAYQSARNDLLGYLTRMVVRADIAEELLQDAALRALQAERLPADEHGMRAWLFRTATNLAIDHLRRHATWRETVLMDARESASRDQRFVAESRLMSGSPEMRWIARDHLVVCFSCTLRNLPPERAAALLLAEVYGFEVREAAEILGVTFGQAKNWIQLARETMRERYAKSCALVAKTGVCYQCVELGEFFNGRGEDPLAGTAKDLDARLQILRENRAAELGPWHRLMMRIVDDILGATD